MFKNLDSNVNFQLNHRYEAKFFSGLGFLANPLKRVNIYFVCEDTMDKLYPPEKRLTLNIECVKEILNSERFRNSETEELINALEKCLKDSVRGTFQAVGLYVPYADLSDFDFSEEVNFPAIFICPERCINWGQKLNIHAPFVFIKVLYHELAHAFLDTYPRSNQNIYKTWWAKLIEESLANLIALTRFKSNYDIAYATKIISSQPIEYRGCFILRENYLLWGSTPVIKPSLFKNYENFKKFLHIFKVLSYLSISEEILEKAIIFKLIPYNPQNLYKLWKNYKQYPLNNDIGRFFKTLALEVLQYL